MNKQKENAPHNRGAVEGKKQFSTEAERKAHQEALLITRINIFCKPVVNSHHKAIIERLERYTSPIWITKGMRAAGSSCFLLNFADNKVTPTISYHL